jgi:Holliday junction resolvasome RuvABC endonuclease subunit
MIKLEKTLGMDISLNHGAIVELTGGRLTNFRYYTTLVGSASLSNRGTRIDSDLFRLDVKHNLCVARLAWIRTYLDQAFSHTSAVYAGIEDYALRAEQGAHQLGEAGGLAKLVCWDNGVRLRLHDPTSVKMFAAHDGTCQKDAVQRAVEDRWGVNFSSLDQHPAQPTAKNPTPKPNMQTSEDLCDAFAVAMLVWVEIQLRHGKIALSDLHEKEVRVFNRITKTYPINLLSREWIYNSNRR